MKILALVTDAFGGYGGIARYNQDFLRALAASGKIRELVVLPRSGEAATSALPPKVVQLKPAQGRVLFSLRAIKTALLNGPFDAVFCGHIYMAPLAALLARMLGVPLWITVHGIEAWRRPGRLRRWALGRASLVTAVSRHTRRRVLSWARILPHRIRVLPNTLGEAFTPGPVRNSLKERYGTDGHKVLLTVSRLNRNDRYKGHERVIAALPKLAAHFPNLIYLIVGDGDDRSYLEQVAEQRGLRDRVVFAGRVEENELADYYRLADVFVMPSTKEGFGIVFLEAAATGVAVIGGDSDGSMDALADGAIGTLVNPTDDEALVRAIESALESPRPPAERVLRFRSEYFRLHVSRLAGHILDSAIAPSPFVTP